MAIKNPISGFTIGKVASVFSSTHVFVQLFTCDSKGAYEITQSFNWFSIEALVASNVVLTKKNKLKKETKKILQNRIGVTF